MNNPATRAPFSARPLRRVLILADESADWKIAGLRQLDRTALSLQEAIRLGGQDAPLEVCVFWNDAIEQGKRWLPAHERLPGLRLTSDADAFLDDEEPLDLVVSTRVFLYRDSIPQLLATLPAPDNVQANGHNLWESHALKLRANLPSRRFQNHEALPWRYVSRPAEIRRCERAFLRYSGKSQDGLVSRHLNRRISRAASRWLLKLPVTPSAWSLLIFALPLVASVELLRGKYLGFVIGTAIFQLYSILDGCDGEIARAKFLQTEFGRRLDSLCDLIGNILLALCLGIGLARQASVSGLRDWFYISEGIAAALLIATSEGIVFIRRSRAESHAGSARWNGALYRRHHEFVERSGILLLGERFAWWIVQLTKRDIAMLGFFFLALAGWPAGILHLQFAVAAISSVLAANAFLRQPAPVLPQEAS